MDVETLRHFFQFIRYPHASTVTNKKQRGLQKALKWDIRNLALSSLYLLINCITLSKSYLSHKYSQLICKITS